ncbi:MAG: hypothetical protein M1434_03775 [Chloroflexi bacterium]|nr:hypothetical protein [Chloroflexota bacterium]MCL5273850.1 hypothetical protein [Chloroflexota bacterium]
MIEAKYVNTLRKIYTRLENLEDNRVNWVVTGSVGMALQGMDVDVHDIDIQTDQDGAYETESRFSEYVVEPVRFSISERIRSHFGTLEIGDIKVEIMGDIQKRLDDQTWEEPVKVERYKCWVEVDGMRIPVLSLEYEYQAYLILGRNEKAEKLQKWLENRKAG